MSALIVLAVIVGINIYQVSKNGNEVLNAITGDPKLSAKLLQQAQKGNWWRGYPYIYKVAILRALQQKSRPR